MKKIILSDRSENKYSSPAISIIQIENEIIIAVNASDKNHSLNLGEGYACVYDYNCACGVSGCELKENSFAIYKKIDNHY